MGAIMTKKRKMTIGGFHRWNEYFGFGTIELAQSFNLNERELKDLLDKIKVAFETNPKEKFCIGSLVVADMEEKYSITKGADLVYAVLFLGLYFAEMRLCALEIFEAWRHLVHCKILMPTQKDDEATIEKLIRIIVYPFIGMDLCKHAIYIGVSERFVSALKVVESWLIDFASVECIHDFNGYSEDERLANLMQGLSDFVYAKVCFEIELAEICANQK